MRAGLRRAVVLAALLAGACGPVPQPFRPPDGSKTDNPFLFAPGAAGIAVQPVRGPAAADGAALARAVAAALRERGVVAGTAANRRAQLLSAVGYREFGAGRSELVIAWTLSGPDGAAPRRRQTRFAPPDGFWDAPTAASYQAVGRALAARTADWLLDDGRRARVAVLGVAGAPKDGDRALRRALEAALRRRGLAGAAPERATVLVRPDLTVGPAGPGRERVRMRWTVTAPDGAGIGRVDQDNTIAAGRLARDWPGVAAAIADAAAPEIARLARVYHAALARRGAQPAQ